MKHFIGLDLHSNNTILGMIDEKGRKAYKKKLPNDLKIISDAIKPFKNKVEGIVVESTFNWYWLVDGLMMEGYNIHLANPSAIKQYEGLKHTDDYDEAFHLANLLRLGILPEGYIYPKEERAIRDLLRKRSMLVRQKTANILSFENLYSRTTGLKIKRNEVMKMSPDVLKQIFEEEHIIFSAQSTISLISYLGKSISEIEKIVLQAMKLKPEFHMLITMPGIGEILALTIALETGDITRFKSVGNYASYCRCVKSIRLSNNKKKGENNRKNGNKYLAWAFMEAAHYAIRGYAEVRRFYQKKTTSTNRIIALKATSHKLARAAYFVMKDKVSFAMERAFASEKIKVAAANHSVGNGHKAIRPDW